MKILLQERNETAQARQEFFHEFEEIFGQTFESWRKTAINRSPYPGLIDLVQGEYGAALNPRTQLWFVYKRTVQTDKILNQLQRAQEEFIKTFDTENPYEKFNVIDFPKLKFK